MNRYLHHSMWVLLLPVLLVFPHRTVQAQITMSVSSFSSGTQLATTSDNRLFGTLGQSLMGLTTNADNYMGGGFWLALQPELPATVDVESDEADIPEVYQLDANYPNPFVPAAGPPTRIRFGLPEPTQLHLGVYNMLGQEVATLVQAQQPAGWFIVTWDGRDGQGSPVASGLYLYQLRSEAFTATRKLMLIR